MRVVTEIFPYDRVHDTYQEYYRNAIKTGLVASGGKYSEISGAYSATFIRLYEKAK